MCPEIKQKSTHGSEWVEKVPENYFPDMKGAWINICAVGTQRGRTCETFSGTEVHPMVNRRVDSGSWGKRERKHFSLGTLSTRFPLLPIFFVICFPPDLRRTVLSIYGKRALLILPSRERERREMFNLFICFLPLNEDFKRLGAS